MTGGPGPNVRRTTRESPGQGGLPCPECGSRIEVTMESLLSRRAFVCRTPGCGVVLRLDQAESAQALNLLRTLKTRLDDLES